MRHLPFPDRTAHANTQGTREFFASYTANRWFQKVTSVRNQSTTRVWEIRDVLIDRHTLVARLSCSTKAGRRRDLPNFSIHNTMSDPDRIPAPSYARHDPGRAPPPDRSHGGGRRHHRLGGEIVRTNGSQLEQLHIRHIIKRVHPGHK